LREDARDMSAALHMTRRVLAEHGRDYRPDGAGAIEVVAAYQSEADYKEIEAGAAKGTQGSEVDFLIAQRLAIPDSENPEDSLKRALQLCSNDAFINRRRKFHDWQREILSHGILPKDVSAELDLLVKEYNEAVRTTEGSYRLETVMLIGGLSAAAIAAFAGIVPAAVAAVGIGALQGAQVVSIGNAAIGAVLQVVRHVRNRKDPDGGAKDFSGAMFHQIENDLGWKLRADPTARA
jgi:hypothetical protein